MTIEDIEASKAPLMDHLIELRSRLIKSMIALTPAAASAGSAFLSNRLLVPIMTTNSFAFDADGALKTLTDGNRHLTTWKYDGFGRLTNKVDHLGTNAFALAQSKTLTRRS